MCASGLVIEFCEVDLLAIYLGFCILQCTLQDEFRHFRALNNRFDLDVAAEVVNCVGLAHDGNLNRECSWKVGFLW